MEQIPNKSYFKQNLISFTCTSKTPVGDVTPEHTVVKYFQMAAREHQPTLAAKTTALDPLICKSYFQLFPFTFIPLSLSILCFANFFQAFLFHLHFHFHFHNHLMLFSAKLFQVLHFHDCSTMSLSLELLLCFAPGVLFEPKTVKSLNSGGNIFF